MRNPKVAIGIDLGTSKCCVGVVHDGRVEILENERANKTTPSFVAFTDTERLVGDEAKDQATLNPTNTVFGVKRLLGGHVDDPVVQELVPYLPYKIYGSNRGKTMLNITYKKKTESLYPEQVTAMLLTKMVGLVKDRFSCSVDEAVISVPASFSNAQRQATKDAATIAGLKVLALINEPTAAAITYQANRKGAEEEIIAVVDFGGGKLEVSFVLVGKKTVDVKEVYGCNRIGGSDVDDALVDLVIDKFTRKHNIKLTTKAEERVRNACEKLKHTLSLLPEARLQLDCLSGDIDFEATVTRMELDELLADYIIKRMDKLWHQIERSSKVARLNIAKVLLVGGSTRIPMVQGWLMKTFGTSKLDKTINPDEAVAQGAALRAALISRHHEVDEIVVHDVIPNPLFLDVDKKTWIIFDKFARVSSIIKTTIPAESSNTVCVLWEERSTLDGSKNLILADFQSNYSIKFAGRINKSGILVASVEVDGKKERLDLLLQNKLRLFSNEDLSELIKREDHFKMDAIRENNRVTALSELEGVCFQLKNSLRSQRGKVPQNLLSDWEAQIEAAIIWIDNNPAASENFLADKKLELEEACGILSSNDKRRSSVRSSSAARHPSSAVSSDTDPGSQERVSRRDAPRRGGDVPKARAVSQSARCFGLEAEGSSGADNGSMSSNRNGFSPQVIGSPTRGLSPQSMRNAGEQQPSVSKMHRPKGESPQRYAGTPHHSREEALQRPSPKRPHSRGASPARPPPEQRGNSHSLRGLSPQTRSEMLWQGHDSNRVNGSSFNQLNASEGVSPLSSQILKRAAETGKGGNSTQPVIKPPLFATDGWLMSKPSNTSNLVATDDQHDTDARRVKETPRSGLRSQSVDQDGVVSLPGSSSHSVNAASASRPFPQDSITNQVPSHPVVPKVPTISSTSKDCNSNYSSVYQSGFHHTQASRSSSSSALRSTNIPASSVSSPTAREAPAATSVSLEPENGSDSRSGGNKEYNVRSIGVQTDFPGHDNTGTCDVCRKKFKCGCTVADSPSGKPNSSNLTRVNKDTKEGLPPGYEYDCTRSAPGTTSATMTSSYNREGLSARPGLFPAQGQPQNVQAQVHSPNITPPITPNFTMQAYPSTTVPKQTTHLNSLPPQAAAFTSLPVITTRAEINLAPSRTNSYSTGRTNILVGSTCIHGVSSATYSSCNTTRPSATRRTSAEGRTDPSAVGAACNCFKVSCTKCFQSLSSIMGSGTPVSRGSPKLGSKVQELLKQFQTAV